MPENAIEQLDWAERQLGILDGEWVFKGTLVPIAALFENLRDGASIDEFLEWFPGVTRQQVTASLNPNRAVDIYELIERIRPRPALYLGSASISRLDSFLIGYRSALDDLKVDDAGAPSFWYFHDWIAMRLGRYESTAGWCSMLLEFHDRDEEKALHSFFSHLEEFKHREARVIFQSSSDPSSRWRQEKNLATGETIDLERPVLVQLVRYTDDKGVFVRYLGKGNRLVDREEYCFDLETAYEETEFIVKRNSWKAPS